MKKAQKILIPIIFVLSFSLLAFGKIKIGEIEYVNFETPHPYSPAAVKGIPVWTTTIKYFDASYIKVHFAKFDLGPGDYVIVRSEDGKQKYIYRDKGKVGTGQFYATFIRGDTAIIELYAPGEKGGFGYVIDHYGRGYPSYMSPFETDFTFGVIPIPSAVCGSTDWKNAVCYSGTVYQRAKAISRLHIGANTACSGWLVGCAGHLMTNEHCITNQADVNNTDFEFMGEGSTCNTNCDSWMACPGSIWQGAGTFITDSPFNNGLDYALIQLAGDPENTYGYLQLRQSGPALGEQMYIVHHPNAWGKKISFDSDQDAGGKCKVDSINYNNCYVQDIGYYCDTAGGSSGSPVLATNDNLVIALHHCGSCQNSGVPIDDIIADLNSKGVLPPCAIPGGCTPPSAPTGLTITNTCNQIALSWNAVSGASGYNIYRKTGTCGGTYTKIGTATSTTYTDSTVTVGSTYSYIVRAYAGTDTCESNDSACVSGSVITAPSSPAAPTVSDDCSGLIISWASVPYAASYNVMRRNNGCGNNGWSAVQSGISGTTWTDTSVAVGSTYGYYIVAVNACGSSGTKNNCTAGTHNLGSAPSAPTGLTAAGTCTSIDLSWNASSGATSYNILRTTNSNCSTGLTQIGTSTTASFSDTTASPGVNYYYVIQAVNACGTSSNSSCASAARLSVPSAPTGLTAAGTCTSIDLSWNASSGSTSYKIFRGNGNCPGTGITQIGTSSVTNYSDTSVAEATTYSYTVKGSNSCGDSANSNCVSTQKLPGAYPTISGANTNTCPSMTVSLSTETGMTNYQWYLNGNPIAGANGNVYSANQTGDYTVSYTNGSGCSGTSVAHSVSITPCIADEVSNDSLHYMKAQKNSNNINIQFEDVGAINYNIYVSNNSNTHPFLVSNSLNGKKDCGIVISNDLGEMLEVLNYNIESGITGSTQILYFIITADNGATTEGPMGKDSSAIDRTADSYCAK